MTRKHKIIAESVAGFLVVMGCVNFLILSHHSPMNTPRLNINNYVPKSMTHSKSNDSYFTEKSFPSSSLGIYASSVPVNTPSLHNYYQFVSLVRITPKRIYQQIAVIPKQQPTHLIKAIPHRTNSSKSGTQFLRNAMTRENQKKQIVHQNVIQSNVPHHVKKANKKKLMKKPKHRTKNMHRNIRRVQQAIPFQARSIMNRSHLRSLVAGINDEAEPGDVVTANGGGYTIQLKDIQRLDGFNRQHVTSMGIPTNLIVTGFGTTNIANIKMYHNQLQSNGATFKRISRKQARSIMNQSKISNYFMGL